MNSRRILPFLAITLGLAAPAAAQHAGHGDPAVSAVKPLYETVKGFLTKAADQMPEEHYAYKPTPEVRSFGQILGHVANAHYMFCSTATGQASTSPGDAEKITSKAGLVEALKTSFAFCDAAYQMSDAKALEATKVFGQDANRLNALIFNVAHDFEHYGNIVTYMREKGLVPPSSQGM